MDDEGGTRLLRGIMKCKRDTENGKGSGIVECTSLAIWY